MHRPNRSAFSVVELLMTVLVVGIVAAVAVPLMDPGIASQLDSVAQLTAADMARGRSLAVTNGSTYRFTFDVASNSYWLEHAGTNPALNTLPPSPFARSSDAPTRHITRLGDLPMLGGAKLLAVLSAANSANRTTIDFGSLGQTSASDATVIWLTAGSGRRQRYLAVTINPVTGLATIGKVQTASPLSGPAGSGS